MLTRLVVGALTLAAAFGPVRAVAGQKTSPQPSAQDSAIIARERATWSWSVTNKTDTTAFARAAGNSARITIVSPGGIERTSPNAVGKSISGCETRKAELDSAAVDHVSETTVVVTYKIMLDRKCGATTLPPALYATSVWARRSGHWQLATLSFAEVGFKAR
jgi:hypothetical protein